MPRKLEAEVLAELKTLDRMDYPDDDLIGCLRQASGQDHLDVYGRPVGTRGAWRVIVSVDRAAPTDPPVYHGTRLADAAQSVARGCVAADRGLRNFIWESIP